MRRGCAPYFRQLLDLVGIEVEFLQGLLKAKDLLRNSLQAAVGVVQRCYRLLLASQAAAGHQTNKQAPLGHPQALERENREMCNKGGEGRGAEEVSMRLVILFTLQL